MGHWTWPGMFGRHSARLLSHPNSGKGYSTRDRQQARHCGNRARPHPSMRGSQHELQTDSSRVHIGHCHTDESSHRSMVLGPTTSAEWDSQTLRQACYRENPESAMCVQNLNDSRGLAIRITYRISLRSSSLWEPRHPPLKVVCSIRF